MNNFEKAMVWLVRAIKAAIAGGFVASLLGALAFHPPNVELFAEYWLPGAILAAAFPAIVFAWFLFLHMISQVSNAIRGTL